MDSFFLNHTELAKHLQNYQGRVTLHRNNIKDDNGYRAVFTEQGAHIAEEGYSELYDYGLVHTLAPVTMAMKKQAAKAAVDKQWNNSRSYWSGTQQKFALKQKLFAKPEPRDFATLLDHCHLKYWELASHVLKCRRSVVLQLLDNVKDDNGASVSLISATNFLGTSSRLLGYGRRSKRRSIGVRSCAHVGSSKVAEITMRPEINSNEFGWFWN